MRLRTEPKVTELMRGTAGMLIWVCQTLKPLVSTCLLLPQRETQGIQSGLNQCPRN